MVTLLFLVVLGVVAVAVLIRLASRPRRKDAAVARKSYVPLNVVSVLMLLVGWTTVICSVVIIPVLIFAGLSLGSTAPALAGMGVLALVGAGVGTLVSGLLLVAGGELILLLIDIEQNTRGAEYNAGKSEQALTSLLRAISAPRQQQPARPAAPQAAPAAIPVAQPRP